MGVAEPAWAFLRCSVHPSGTSAWKPLPRISRYPGAFGAVAAGRLALPVAVGVAWVAEKAGLGAFPFDALP